MLYRLVIADDEKPIRTGLVKYIDWKALGFEVVGCFEDGADVLRYLRENSADVVITDIKMNRVTGLDIAKDIYENRLPIKVVLISGHKEFDFAREAIRYGVCDYVLKPVRFDQIHRIFANLKTQLDQAERDKARKQAEQRQVSGLSWKLRQQFFLELMSGDAMDFSALHSRLAIADENGRLRQSRLGLCQLSLPGQNAADEEQLRTAMISELQGFADLAQESLEAFYLDGSTGNEGASVRLAVLLPDSLADHGTVLKNYCQELVDYINAFMNHCAAFSIIGIYDTFELAMGQLLGERLPSSTPGSAVAEQAAHGPQPYPAGPDGASPDSIQKALLYIRKNYNCEITLHDVAAKVFLNPVYFSRLFKQRTGRNFIDFLTDVRIQAAIEIMEKKQKPIKDIGSMVGMHDSKYFARVFKRRTGYSPSGYFRR